MAPTTVAAWRGWLNPEEIARADRFRFDADRVAYVGAHALVRGVLASVGPHPAEEWRFVCDERGRPEIDPALASPLRCNLSHSRGLVAAAVSLRHDVGVDVERCDRTPRFEDLARRYFTPDEVALVRSDAADGGRRRLLPAVDPEGGVHQGDRRGPRAFAPELRFRPRPHRGDIPGRGRWRARRVAVPADPAHRATRGGGRSAPGRRPPRVVRAGGRGARRPRRLAPPGDVNGRASPGAQRVPPAAGRRTHTGRSSRAQPPLHPHPPSFFDQLDEQLRAERSADSRAVRSGLRRQGAPCCHRAGSRPTSRACRR